MKNLHEVYENNYLSNQTFKAEDNNSFEFAVTVEVTDLDSACGEAGYLVSVNASKLPKYLTQKQRKSVASCMGINQKEISNIDIAQYGLCAPLESHHVLTMNEVDILLNSIDEKIPAYGLLCGFYFDKPANRIGNTGWDFLNGKIG